MTTCPGVPSVGPKTAAKWINQFGSLEEIVARVDEIPGRAGDALREHLADVIRNRRINALVNDLELSASIADTAARAWDRDEVHKVFDSLEFRVLRDRLFETLSADEPQIGAAAEVDGVRLGAGETAGWLAEHASGRGPYRDCSWSGSGPAAPDRSTRSPSPLPAPTVRGPPPGSTPTEITPEDESALAGWLADPERPKALHDAKGPMLALEARGWPLARPGCRHGPVGVPLASRPALLRPRRPDPALPPPRAQRRERRQCAALLRSRRRLHRRHRRDGQGPRRDRPGRRARHRAREPWRNEAAGRRRAPAGRGAGPDGARGHRGRRRSAGESGVGVRRPRSARPPTTPTR